MSSFSACNRMLRRNLFWRKRKTGYGEYKIVYPQNVSPRKFVLDHISKPSYHTTGMPTEHVPEYPEVKKERQIEKMRESCRLAATILQRIERWIEVGNTTDEVDVVVHNACLEHKVYPSPLNYNGFPKSVCTSVNNVACHGIPDDRPLEDGDIVNVDITVFCNGYHGDCSKTFLIGNVDAEGRSLVDATETCLREAVRICGPGASFKDIGACIQRRAFELGYRVVPSFIGHGIGSYFHGPPDIYHTSNSYPGKMLPGMTFTIEPVLTQGGETVEILEDNWTAVTADSARAAQVEHTVLITESGVEILTLPS